MKAQNHLWRTVLSGLAASLFASALGAQGAQPQSTSMSSERFVRSGVYVVATDLAASAKFYERVFDRSPTLRTANFVAFNVAGGLFGIALRTAFAPNSSIGGNVVPYIRVTDIDAEFARIRGVAPDALLANAVTREGPLALFKFKDPDGNVIEYFALTSPR